MNRIEKLREFILENGHKGRQTFDCRNIVGDPMWTIYNEDGITVDECSKYDYLEIFGLSNEEYQGLSDILDIC